MVERGNDKTKAGAVVLDDDDPRKFDPPVVPKK